jgi:AraC-like DNA-binding protein
MKHIGPNTMLTSIFDLAEAFGADRNDIIAEIDIDTELAHSTGAMIETEKTVDAFAYAAILTGRPDFGLEWGVRNARRVLGPLSIFVEHCQSAREAVEQGAKFLRLHNSATVYSMVTGRTHDRLRLEVLTQGKYPQQQFVEAAMVSILQFLRALQGPKWVPTEMRFVHQRGATRSIYQHAFGCPITFGNEMNCFVAPKAEFNARTTPRDERIKEFVHGMLQEIDRQYHDDLPEKIRVMLRAMIASGTANSTEVAKNLNLPPRTMQRKLAEEGTTFKDILTQERLKLAVGYLAQGDLGTSALAPILGFSETSSVSRFLRENSVELKRLLDPRKKMARLPQGAAKKREAR